MRSFTDLIAYLHPSSKALLALSREELQKLFTRNAWMISIGFTLFNFTVKDPEGNILVALWDAIVTVFLFGAGFEGFRVLRRHFARQN